MNKSTLKTCNVAEMKAYHGGVILGALVLLAVGALLAVETVLVIERIYSSLKGGSLNSNQYQTRW